MNNAKALLRKGVRINDKVRITDATKIPGYELERFIAGDELSPDKMDKLASYIFTGHKRYDAETDTLVSLHTAAPMPQGIGMSVETIKAAIEASRTQSGGFKRVR